MKRINEKEKQQKSAKVSSNGTHSHSRNMFVYSFWSKIENFNWKTMCRFSSIHRRHALSVQLKLWPISLIIRCIIIRVMKFNFIFFSYSLRICASAHTSQTRWRRLTLTHSWSVECRLPLNNDNDRLSQFVSCRLLHMTPFRRFRNKERRDEMQSLNSCAAKKTTKKLLASIFCCRFILCTIVTRNMFAHLQMPTRAIWQTIEMPMLNCWFTFGLE